MKPRALIVAITFTASFTITIHASPPSAWRSVGPGGGGALFAPAWSPFNSSELYLACDMSQQFHSTNTGQSWSITPFTRLQVSGSAPKVQFTNNPLILYMVDFTGEIRTPVKSVDGGATWAALAGDPTGADVWAIIGDPNDANRVMLTSYDTLYASTNGGASFALKYTALDSGAGLNIGGAFFDPPLIALGTNDGILVSTNNGASFGLANLTGIPATEAIVSFAGGKSGGTTRFFAVTLGSGDVYNGVQGDSHPDYQHVYSLDYGASTAWQQKTGGIAAGHHPFFVGMARNNVTTAWLAGGSTAGVPVIYKTTNAGTSWQNTLITANNQNILTGWQGASGDRDWSYGELVFGFDVHPTDSNRAVFTDYGFAHLTTDAGTNWHQAYVSTTTQNPANAPTPKGRSYLGIGLENTTCWSLAWANTNNMWASYSDIRGTRSTDGGNTWGFNYTGHTANSSYKVVVHPTTGAMYLAASSVHDMYQSTTLTDARIDGGSGSVLFSTNTGATWQTLGGITKPVVWLALDPMNSNRMYASVTNSSSGGIYVCNNLSAGTGASWQHLPNPPRTQGHAFNIVVLNDGSLVATFSGRRAGSPLNFTASSGVFYSTDGGQTWADRSDPKMLYWTNDVTIDPHDAGQNKWYVGVFSGFGGAANDKGGLYYSNNRGQSWTQISALSHVTSSTVDPRPANADEMYLTTEQDGLWFSSNRTAASPVFTQVASYSFRQPERVFFNPYKAGEIWVTSFGHGLRVSAVSRGDCNNDGGFTTAGDIPCFIGLLLGTNTDPGAIFRSDFNGDGLVDGADIPSYLACALSGCS